MALFDFSERRASNRAAALAIGDELPGLTRGRDDRMLVTRVGDALQEPFWPEGLGINRGFLHAFDCADLAQVCATSLDLPVVTFYGHPWRLYGLPCASMALPWPSMALPWPFPTFSPLRRTRPGLRRLPMGSPEERPWQRWAPPRQRPRRQCSPRPARSPLRLHQGELQLPRPQPFRASNAHLLCSIAAALQLLIDHILM